LVADLSRRLVPPKPLGDGGSDSEGGFVAGQTGRGRHYPGMAQKSTDETMRSPGIEQSINRRLYE